MKTLHLSLKREWFEMIKSGDKKEEYREINPYWAKRLLWDADFNCSLGEEAEIFDSKLVINGIDAGCFIFRHFDTVEFSLGYPKKDDYSRRILKEIVNISIGKPKHGLCPKDAEGKDYFVIKLK